MNLKGRYSILIAVVMTFIVVFYVPFGSHEPKCKKCLDCSDLLNEISILPNMPRDMVVVRSSEMVNKSFNELRLMRLKQILSEQMLFQPKLADRGVMTEQKAHFVLDCVTQAKLIQKDQTQDYLKSEFSPIENGTSRIGENVTKSREIWLMKSLKINQNMDELVAFNVLINQLKVNLRQEFVSILHIFCGEVEKSIIQELLKSRGDILYTGIDTSSRVTTANQKVAQSMGKETHFHTYDILRHGLQQKFNLIIVLNTEGFLNDKQIASLLLEINQSKSSYMLVDFELVNRLIVASLNSSDNIVAQAWNLGLNPNKFKLDFPVCLKKIKSGKVWSFWELPLSEISLKS